MPIKADLPERIVNKFKYKELNELFAQLSPLSEAQDETRWLETFEKEQESRDKISFKSYEDLSKFIGILERGELTNSFEHQQLILRILSHDDLAECSPYLKDFKNIKNLVFQAALAEWNSKDDKSKPAAPKVEKAQAPASRKHLTLNLVDFDGTFEIYDKVSDTFVINKNVVRKIKQSYEQGDVHKLDIFTQREGQKSVEQHRGGHRLLTAAIPELVEQHGLPQADIGISLSLDTAIGGEAKSYVKNLKQFEEVLKKDPQDAEEIRRLLEEEKWLLYVNKAKLPLGKITQYLDEVRKYETEYPVTEYLMDTTVIDDAFANLWEINNYFNYVEELYHAGLISVLPERPKLILAVGDLEYGYRKINKPYSRHEAVQTIISGKLDEFSVKQLITQHKDILLNDLVALEALMNAQDRYDTVKEFFADSREFIIEKYIKNNRVIHSLEFEFALQDLKFNKELQIHNALQAILDKIIYKINAGEDISALENCVALILAKKDAAEQMNSINDVTIKRQLVYLADTTKEADTENTLKTWDAITQMQHPMVKQMLLDGAIETGDLFGDGRKEFAEAFIKFMQGEQVVFLKEGRIYPTFLETELKEKPEASIESTLISYCLPHSSDDTCNALVRAGRLEQILPLAERGAAFRSKTEFLRQTDAEEVFARMLQQLRAGAAKEKIFTKLARMAPKTLPAEHINFADFFERYSTLGKVLALHSMQPPLSDAEYEKIMGFSRISAETQQFLQKEFRQAGRLFTQYQQQLLIQFEQVLRSIEHLNHKLVTVKEKPQSFYELQQHEKAYKKIKQQYDSLIQRVFGADFAKQDKRHLQAQLNALEGCARLFSVNAIDKNAAFGAQMLKCNKLLAQTEQTFTQLKDDSVISINLLRELRDMREAFSRNCLPRGFIDKNLAKLGFTKNIHPVAFDFEKLNQLAEEVSQRIESGKANKLLQSERDKTKAALVTYKQFVEVKLREVHKLLDAHLNKFWNKFNVLEQDKMIEQLKKSLDKIIVIFNPIFNVLPKEYHDYFMRLQKAAASEKLALPGILTELLQNFGIEKQPLIDSLEKACAKMQKVIVDYQSQLRLNRDIETSEEETISSDTPFSENSEDLSPEGPSDEEDEDNTPKLRFD